MEGLNGLVTIDDKPRRVLTASLGHTEVTYGLVPPDRVVAVGQAAQKPVYSNVADLAQDLPVISRDAEQIVAQDPEVVVTSPFAKKALVKSLEDVGVTVVQTSMEQNPQARIRQILFMGYVYGEEERAKELAEEVERRYQQLIAVTHARPKSERPSVLSAASFGGKIYAAGEGSTEGGIIRAAGGINVAAREGIEDHKTISRESIIAMRPEVIMLPMPRKSVGGLTSGRAFKEKLMTDPSLAEVPAVANDRVYIVKPRLFTTLSYWNLRGGEELARLLWPDDFADKEFPPFSFPQQR